MPLQPDAPLAHYDLGVARLADGQDGLPELATADRLACSIFLQHQIVLWRLARELDVPVVDLTLFFQAHDGEELFLDPAHPNAAGSRIIAEALWPALRPPSRSNVVKFSSRCDRHDVSHEVSATLIAGGLNGRWRRSRTMKKAHAELSAPGTDLAMKMVCHAARRCKIVDRVAGLC
jgi:hypothetical protein